jgi:hypothetical protein
MKIILMRAGANLMIIPFKGIKKKVISNPNGNQTFLLFHLKLSITGVFCLIKKGANTIQFLYVIYIFQKALLYSIFSFR